MNKIFIVVLIFIFSFLLFKKENYPDIRITSTLMNNSATSVDKKITRPIEKILFQIGEIEDIKSESVYEKNIIDIYLKKKPFLNVNNIKDEIARDILLEKEKIGSGAEILFDENFNEIYDVLIGITNENGNYEELYTKTENIKDEFLKLKRRDKVAIKGDEEQTLYLFYKSPYFSNLKLTNDLIKKEVSNINPTFGGGYYETGKNIIELNSENKFREEDDIKKRIINIEGKPIKLEDIFEIEKTVKIPKTKLTLINGKRGLILAVSKMKGANGFLFNKEVFNLVQKLNKKYNGVEIIYNKKLFQNNYLYFEILTDNGRNFNETKNIVLKSEDFLNKNNVQNYTAFIGYFPPKINKKVLEGVEKPNFAAFIIKTKNKNKIKREFENYLKNNFSIVQIKTNYKNPIKVKISNKNFDNFIKQKENFKNELNKINGISFISDDWGRETFSLGVKINENLAAQYGISPVEIFNFLNGFYNGITLTNYFKDDVKIPVVLKGKEFVDINSLAIYSNKLKKIIPIGEFAQIKPKLIYPKILRSNNEYCASFIIEPNNLEIKRKIKQILKNNYNYEILKN